MKLPIFHWRINTPMSQAGHYDDNNNFTPLDKEVLDKKIAIRKDDRVVILSHRDGDKRYPALTEPIKGDTIKALLKAIEKGMNRTIEAGDRSKKSPYYFEKSQKYPFPEKNIIVYQKISGYFDSSNRLKYVKKFENGTLKPHELYGDHIYFEGVQRSGKYLYLVLGS